MDMAGSLRFRDGEFREVAVLEFPEALGIREVLGLPGKGLGLGVAEGALEAFGAFRVGDTAARADREHG